MHVHHMHPFMCMACAQVLEGMPEVAEVTVSLDAEAPAASAAFGAGIVVGRKVNPLMGELMRSPAEIEADVRARAAISPASSRMHAHAAAHAHAWMRTRRVRDRRIAGAGAGVGE